MVNYAECITIGRLHIVTWILPGFTEFLCNEKNLKHVFGPIFWAL